MTSYQAISHFKGLNSLRFFAAFLVLVHHAESLRKEHNLHDLARYSFAQNGQHAVTFFFVLSGFLITYLLLKERKETTTISIKRFYIKRIFRIWPLYFLLVFIGLVLQPYFIQWFDIPYEMPFTLSETWGYYLFFLPGLVNFFFGNHLLEPLWSIGVEEVFYLFWAPAVKWVKKHLLYLLLFVIGIKLFFLWLSNYANFPPVWKYLIRIHQFEAMAIGGLGAYLVFHYGQKLTGSWLFKFPTQCVIYGTVGMLLFADKSLEISWWRFLFDTPLVGILIKDILFIYLILGVSLAKNPLIRFDGRSLSYLGQISYGIYMFHLVVLTQVIPLFKGLLSGLSPITETVLYYLLSVLGTIGVAAISHRTFERFFEKKKQQVLNR